MYRHNHTYIYIYIYICVYIYIYIHIGPSVIIRPSIRPSHAPDSRTSSYRRSPQPKEIGEYSSNYGLGNLREQTGEDGCPRKPSGSLFYSNRTLRKYPETSGSCMGECNLGILPPRYSRRSPQPKERASRSQRARRKPRRPSCLTEGILFYSISTSIS